VRRDLAAEGLGRDRVLAAAVRLLDRGMFRIGSEDYAEQHQSYGLPTLLKGEDQGWADVTSSEINGYLKAATGDDFSAKDFRDLERDRDRRCIAGRGRAGYEDGTQTAAHRARGDRPHLRPAGLAAGRAALGVFAAGWRGYRNRHDAVRIRAVR
jgi:DNA topoisomerase I